MAALTGARNGWPEGLSMVCTFQLLSSVASFPELSSGSGMEMRTSWPPELEAEPEAVPM